MTLSIETLGFKCHFAEGRYLFIVMLSIVMLCIIMVNYGECRYAEHRGAQAMSQTFFLC
jgi:hypothetical protein